MLKNRTAWVSTVGLVTAGSALLCEAIKNGLHPTISIWTSHFITIGFTALLAMVVTLCFLRWDERSRHALMAESSQRQRAEEKARAEALAREQLEHQLRSTEERMGMAINAARIGFFDWNCIDDQQVWSATAKQLLGLAADSAATMTMLMHATHPEDREELAKVLEGLSAENSNFTCEHRAVWQDGSVHWIWVKGKALFNEQGQRCRVAGVVMDIDERKRTEEQLGMQAAALQHAANAVVLTDSVGTIEWVNHAFSRITGYEPEEVIGKNPRILRSGQQDGAFYSKLWQTISAGQVWHGEIVNRKKSGDRYSEEMTIAPLRSHTGAITHFVAIKQDITDRKMAEQALQGAEEKYRSIVNNAVLGICQTTPTGEFITVNPALAKLAGFESPEEFLNNVHSATEFYTDLKQRGEVRRLLSARKEVRNFEMQVRARDGRQLTISLNMRALSGPDGNTYHHGTVQDITEQKAAQEKILFLAYHDVLTGLPNRAFFEERLGQALADASSRRERVAVILIDIDDFKVINDTLGHSVGDLLLKEVAQRLMECNRGDALVARVGGDEFACVWTNVHQIQRAEAAANRMRQELMRGFSVRDHQLQITCSAGISVFPEHGTDGETLIKNADLAMYQVKENGRNGVGVFNPGLNARVVERRELENRLRSALEKQELFLVYQPLVDIASHKIVGAEALLRWQNADLGLVPPTKFIPIAENNGLIVPLGAWVLNTACAQLRRWHEAGLDIPSVSVNVSAPQLRDASFSRSVHKALATHRLPPRSLELEITEGVLLSNTNRTHPALQTIADMGVRLSIDDFGTGYSSLSYLKDLPVNKLKIDRSFLRTMMQSPRNAEIISAVVRMGKGLGLVVLAEGVETREQLSFLEAHGCDEAQGYYFSKPQPPEEFADLLRREAGPPIWSVETGSATTVLDLGIVLQ